MSEVESNDDRADDRSTISRFQGGDEHAFDELMRRHQPTAYRFARNLTKDDDEAGDVVADTFLRVFRSLSRYRGDGAFTSWLYRIELNCFLDIRKKARFGSTFSLDAILSGPEGLVSKAVINDRETPHDYLERREGISTIEKAMKRLSPGQQEVFMMFQADAMSYEDIATALAVPVGTIKSRLNRARVHIRQTIRSKESVTRQHCSRC